MFLKIILVYLALSVTSIVWLLWEMNRAINEDDDLVYWDPWDDFDE